MNKCRRRKAKARRRRARMWTIDIESYAPWRFASNPVVLGVDYGRTAGFAVMPPRTIDGLWQHQVLNARPFAFGPRPRQQGKTAAYERVKKLLESGALTIPKPCA